jgi:hypothetical protein
MLPIELHESRNDMRDCKVQIDYTHCVFIAETEYTYRKKLTVGHLGNDLASWEQV